MDKSAIKKYAVWARRELISRVSQRAALYEITDKGYGDASADSVLGRVMSAEEKRQRQALIAQIREKGYEQVMEEIAYTWFNRFIALRFMEVNGYLPSRVRVFTDDENNFKPQILTEAINMDLDGLDMEKVYALKNANDDDALFKYLIIVQCNALSGILPGMFQKIADYTELLFPDNLLRAGSVIEQMVSMIPEEDWTDQVQIIGWLYQYYNTEPKDKVFADLKKNIKISKENIPAATQLFTPDWIVRYMVENSLGRLWLEGHPNDDLRAGWKYYLDEAEQEPDVQAQLAEIRKEYAALKPEEIRAIDPCQGSGHILAYMFDVLVQIYESYGYTAREAAARIVEHNIWGLDIDERAVQLAYFSVMMKARQYDRRFFTRDIQPHVYVIQESNNIDNYAINFFVNGRGDLERLVNVLVASFHDALEYGSLVEVLGIDFQPLHERLQEIQEDVSPNIYSQVAIDTMLPLIQVGEALAKKYHVVVTNPPYMSSSGMSGKLADFVKQKYPDSKADLFSVFIEKCLSFTKTNGFTSMVTMQAWMFLSSFEKLRTKVLSRQLSSLIRIGYNSFPEMNSQVAHACAFSIVNSQLSEYNSKYFELNTGKVTDDKERVFLQKKACKDFFVRSRMDLEKIPGAPLAFSLSDNTIHSFNNPKLAELAKPRQGLATGENNRFLRLWFECGIDNISFTCPSVIEAAKTGRKWFPYNKGGDFRKWYGNNDYVVNWENDGFEIKHFYGENGRLKSRPQNIEAYFKRSITWSKISTDTLAFRRKPVGHIFDVAGTSFFASDEMEDYLHGLCNSVVAMQILKAIAPTLNFEVGHIASLPVIYDKEQAERVISLVRQTVDLSKADWDAFEFSWDFKKHPLLRGLSLIEDAFNEWSSECDSRFSEMQRNEEALNAIFIEIYGLADELSPLVDDKYITVRKADAKREVKSLISYAVGCMFGRYSLDMPGVAFAGGKWIEERYVQFCPDKDGIIPICDDEYFSDDIVGLFEKFLRKAFGEDTLLQNMQYIADVLGGVGQPKDIIRKYFLEDFYTEHCATYSVKGSGMRPIYWLFDSGDRNGFKCLIYMHRYQPDTIARIRTDYVHEQQSRYRTAIADLESRIAGAGTGERVKLSKQLTKLQDQAEELRVYEEKIHHLADQMIRIDLDDGVKVNYAKFQDVLAKIK